MSTPIYGNELFGNVNLNHKYIQCKDRNTDNRADDNPRGQIAQHMLYPYVDSN